MTPTADIIATEGAEPMLLRIDEGPVADYAPLRAYVLGVPLTAERLAESREHARRTVHAAAVMAGEDVPEDLEDRLDAEYEGLEGAVAGISDPFVLCWN